MPEPQPGEVVVSVVGEAFAAVDPDIGTVHLGFSVTAATKGDASIEAGKVLEDLLAGLAALGGLARTAETDSARLTWATTSVRSQPEYGQHGPTGRSVASVQVEIRVRDFSLLQPLQAVLDAHPSVQTHGAAWQVEPTNPAWRAVRARAVDDAIARAQDYARALGGGLVRIDHLADRGLLAGAPPAPAPARFSGRAVAGAVAAVGGGPQAPSLDPVPQVLSAVVEARFAASGVAVPRA